MLSIDVHWAWHSAGNNAPKQGVHTKLIGVLSVVCTVWYD